MVAWACLLAALPLACTALHGSGAGAGAGSGGAGSSGSGSGGAAAGTGAGAGSKNGRPPEPITFCNPLNLGYRFRLEEPSRREAADSTMTVFNNTYFLFASKSGGYWHSPDLLNWTLVVPTGLPLEDYAPTALVLNGRLFWTSDCFAVYTTDDPVGSSATPAHWTKVASLKDTYKDPCLFSSGGKVYMYYGASPDQTGIHGVQLDPSDGWKEVGAPVQTIPTGL